MHWEHLHDAAQNQVTMLMPLQKSNTLMASWRFWEWQWHITLHLSLSLLLSLLLLFAIYVVSFVVVCSCLPVLVFSHHCHFPSSLFPIVIVFCHCDPIPVDGIISCLLLSLWLGWCKCSVCAALGGKVWGA